MKKKNPSLIENISQDKGRACRRAGGKCVRSNRAARICKEYADDANDCGESKECCLGEVKWLTLSTKFLCSYINTYLHTHT